MLTRSSLGETEKLLKQSLTTSCSHNISCFPRLPLTFLQFNSNHRKFSVLELEHLLVMSVKKYHAHLNIP